MKRYMWLVLVLAGMVGCDGEEPAGALPPSPLAEAKQHLRAASAGYVTNPDFEGTAAEFRAEQLTKAREAFDRALSQQADQLSEMQMAAAAKAMAAVEAERARRLVIEAIDAWAQQLSPLAIVAEATEDAGTNRLPAAGPATIFVQMARLRTIASVYGDRETGVLTDTNLELADARQALQELQADKIQPLKDRIDTVQAEIESLREKQRTLSREAARLLDRAMDRTGDERLALYTDSMTRSNRADAAAGDLDLAQLRLQRARSDLAIARLEADRLRSRIDVMDGLVNQINTEQREVRNQASEAAQTADRLQSRLVETLNQRASEHETAVADRFDRAAEHLQAAIEVLSNVRGRVSGDHRGELTLMLASKHASLGQTLRQAALADRAYAALMSMVGDWARENLPSTNSARRTLISLAENADQRLGNVTDRAVAALQTAAEQLAEAEDTLRAYDDRLAAQTLLVNVYQGLHTLPTQTDYEGELDAARSDLEDMRE